MSLFVNHDDDGHQETSHGTHSRKNTDASPTAHPTHLPPSSQEILDVEQIMDEATGLELTAENVDTVMSL